ncbi:protein of unknown function (plasmid) [Pararobbsia alpina]
MGSRWRFHSRQDIHTDSQSVGACARHDFYRGGLRKGVKVDASETLKVMPVCLTARACKLDKLAKTI